MNAQFGFSPGRWMILGNRAQSITSGPSSRPTVSHGPSHCPRAWFVPGLSLPRPLSVAQLPPKVACVSEDRDEDCMRPGTVGARAWGLLAASLCWVPPRSARVAGSWLGDLQTPVFWGGTGHQPSCLALLPVSPAARPLHDKHWGAAAWAGRRRPRPCSPLLVRPVCGAVIPVARRGRVLREAP